MSWLITGTQKTDPDALAYLAEVERADGQALESGVRNAVIAFVTGCKADGIWNAVKASCILAGARTLAGALVPLVGTAPTNVGGLFVSDDYNRKTGLLGNGTTKYLNSNRANNADPRNSCHNAVFVTTAASADGHYISGAGENGGNTLFRSGTSFTHRNRSNPSNTSASASSATGLLGHNRSLSNEYIFRHSGANQTFSVSSQATSSTNTHIFALATGAGISNARLAFYSIGESLNLALLDARVTTLIQAIDAAI